MNVEELLALPARPPSEVEWEDLLLRVEVMPKVLRVHLERIESGHRDAALLTLLNELVRRELFVRDFLESAATGTSDRPPGEEPQLSANHMDAVDRFVRLRTRNFAMVQRRGLEVWDWQQKIGATMHATVFQLLTRLASEDVELLAALRLLTGEPGQAC